MNSTLNITVVGVGDVGCMAASCFPDLEEHRVDAVMIDSKDELDRRSAERPNPHAALNLSLSLSPQEQKSRNIAFATLRHISKQIEPMISYADGVVLFAGMSGLMGGLIAPAIANLCSSAFRIPVIAQVHMPSKNEGDSSYDFAQDNLNKLIAHTIHTSILNGNHHQFELRAESLKGFHALAAGIQAWHAFDLLRIANISRSSFSNSRLK